MFNLIAAGTASLALIFDIVAMSGLARVTKKFIIAQDEPGNGNGLARNLAGDKFGKMWFIVFAYALYLIATIFFAITNRIAKTSFKVFTCASMAMLWGFAVNYVDRVPDNYNASPLVDKKLVAISDTLEKADAVMAGGFVALSVLTPFIIIGSAFASEEAGSKSSV